MSISTGRKSASGLSAITLSIAMSHLIYIRTETQYACRAVGEQTAVFALVSRCGLYRNVRLLTTEPVCVPVWGTQLTTPHVSDKYASVRLRTEIANAGNKHIRIVTEIISPDGKVVAAKDNTRKINHGQPFEQNFLVDAPALWSPETPRLYKASSKYMPTAGWWTNIPPVSASAA